MRPLRFPCPALAAACCGLRADCVAHALTHHTPLRDSHGLPARRGAGGCVMGAVGCAGQMIFSPKGGPDDCEIYFGYIQEATGPPPTGSGSLVFYDSQQVQYEATFTPYSFVVKAPGCTYFFDGPQIETESRAGAYKLVLDGELSGPACPTREETDCLQGYWVGTTAAGALAFTDAARSFCPAFFAVVDPKSTSSDGSFSIVAVSVVHSTDWAGPGFSGMYTSEKVVINTPGCSGTYKLDPAAGMAPLELPGAPVPRPGSATMNFVGSYSMDGSVDMCEETCASQGFNLAWDATGSAPRLTYHAPYIPCHAKPLRPIPYPSHRNHQAPARSLCARPRFAQRPTADAPGSHDVQARSSRRRGPRGGSRAPSEITDRDPLPDPPGRYRPDRVSTDPPRARRARAGRADRALIRSIQKGDFRLIGLSFPEYQRTIPCGVDRGFRTANIQIHWHNLRHKFRPNANLRRLRAPPGPER